MLFPKRLFIHSPRLFSSSVLGQPSSHTHPHLVKEGEITPGISKTEYEARRSKLLSAAEKHCGSGKFSILLPGYKLRYATNNIFYPFHQHTDMFYATGFEEPNAFAILCKSFFPEQILGWVLGCGSNRKIARYHGTDEYRLFVPPSDAFSELWEGPRAGIEGAINYFGATEAFSNNKFLTIAEKLLKDSEVVYCDTPLNPNLFASDTIMGLIDRKKFQVRSLAEIIQPLRLVKSDQEVNLMRKAGKISGKSIIQTMKSAFPGINENSVAAEMEYNCRKLGAKGLAYVPVVAAGSRALILHYVANNQVTKPGDLILMDSGCEFGGYASDITRTWPITGKYTPEQKELYQVVLNVQKACINLCAESQGYSLDEIHKFSMQFMKSELLNAGINTSYSTLENILYPHHVGHYIGLDVHDTPAISRRIPLRKGMAITIEPGLYIPDDEQFPKHFRNIGIRIEDDVLIQPNHPIILSVDAPKELVDIEALMTGGESLN